MSINDIHVNTSECDVQFLFLQRNISNGKEGVCVCVCGIVFCIFLVPRQMAHQQYIISVLFNAFIYLKYFN